MKNSVERTKRWRHTKRGSETRKLQTSRYRKKHKKEIQARIRLHYHNNKEQYTTRARNYKLFKRTNGTGVTNQQLDEILRRHNHRCAYCGKKCSLTMDHVIPVSKGGEHSPNNIVPACAECNDSKGTKLWTPKIYCK